MKKLTLSLILVAGITQVGNVKALSFSDIKNAIQGVLAKQPATDVATAQAQYMEATGVKAEALDLLLSTALSNPDKLKILLGRLGLTNPTVGQFKQAFAAKFRAQTGPIVVKGRTLKDSDILLAQF